MWTCAISSSAPPWIFSPGIVRSFFDFQNSTLGGSCRGLVGITSAPDTLPLHNAWSRRSARDRRNSDRRKNSLDNRAGFATASGVSSAPADHAESCARIGDRDPPARHLLAAPHAPQRHLLAERLLERSQLGLRNPRLVETGRVDRSRCDRVDANPLGSQLE